MAESFTMFPKFGDVLKALNADDAPLMSYAISMYGMFGEEVELPYHLAALFVALKEDIDNSKECRRAGSRGGKRSKKRDSTLAHDCDETVSTLAKDAHDDVTPLAQCDAEIVTPLAHDAHDDAQRQQANTNTNTNTKPNQANRGMRMRRPTVEEVRAYCAEKGYAVDPERFVAHYESNGWMVGKSPMRSWKATCTTWHLRDQGGGMVTAGKLMAGKEAVDDEYSRL